MSNSRQEFVIQSITKRKEFSGALLKTLTSQSARERKNRCRRSGELRW
jgi:hypothetical protein